MSRNVDSPEVPETGTDDDLERLLQMERRLASMLAAAKEKADRIVSEARQHALDERASAAREIDRAKAQLEREFTVEHRRNLESMRAESERQVRRLDAITDHEIERISSQVLDLILGDEGLGP